MKEITSSRLFLNVPYRLSSAAGDRLCLHLGKHRRVTVLVADAPFLLTVRSRLCCTLVKLAIASGATFDLGGFWFEGRGCHVPVILLRIELLGLVLAYTPSMVTEEYHKEFFRQFPGVDLLVQDFTVSRPRNATRTLPAHWGESLRKALTPGSRKAPATMALLSPNGVEAEVILGCSGERSGP
jgi:hypothetical protein